MLTSVLSLMIVVSQAPSGQAPSECLVHARGCDADSSKPVIDTLHLARRIVEDTLLARVSDLVVAGPHLLLAHGGVSPHLTLVDRETGAVVNKMGTHGNARSELEFPGCLQSMSTRGDLVSLVDTPTGRIITMTIDNAGRASLEDVVRIQSRQVPICAVWMGEHILSNALFPDRLFYYFDHEGALQRRQHVDSPPFPGERLLNFAVMARHPRGDGIAMAYHSASRVDFLDGRGIRKRSVRTSSTPDRTHVSYVSISAALDYVFVGHCGCDPKRDRVQFAKRIDVLSWNGEMVRQLVLDTPLMAMAVTPDGKRLYGAFKAGSGFLIGEWRVP